jgi:hypothetical protein
LKADFTAQLSLTKPAHHVSNTILFPQPKIHENFIAVGFGEN